MINEQIYGTPENWKNSYWTSNTTMTVPNKIASFDNNVNRAYLRIGVYYGRLSYDTPIDKSLSYCGMDMNAPLSNINGITFVDDEPTETKHEKRGATNFALFERISAAGTVDGYQTMYNKLVYNYDTRYKYWNNGDNPLSNCNYNQEPLTQVVPKNQVILIFVLAYNAAFSSNITVTLHDYLTQYTTTYPNIVSVFGTLYYGNATPRSVNAGQGDPQTNYATVGVMLLDKIHFNDNTDFDYCYSLFERFGYQRIPIMIADDRLTAEGGVYLQSGDIGITYGTDIKYHKVETNKYIPYIEYSTNFKEQALRAAAYYGLFFTDRITTAESGLFTDDNMYLGVIDSTGLTHGDYTRGNLNQTNPTYNYNNMHDSGYDYTKHYDDNTYNRTTVFNTISGSSTLTKRYVLNGNGVLALGTDLWSIGTDLFNMDNTYNNYIDKIYDTYLVESPMKCITNLRRFPMLIPKPDNSENLKLGKKEVQTIGYAFPYTTFEYLFTPISIYPRFDDTYLDYAPYTKYELYVPFCGTTEINAGDIIGTQLAVKMIVDFTTGVCTAYIMSDNLVIKTMDGTCAVELPVEGTDATAVASQLNNAIAQNKAASAQNLTGVASLITSPVQGAKNMLLNPSGTMNTIAQNRFNKSLSDYNLTHIDVPVNQIGTASSANSWAIDLDCRLYIYYPTSDLIIPCEPPRFDYDKLSDFGHNSGFATIDTCKLSKYSGLVVADNLDLSGISATDDEKEMIRQAVREGIIL